MIDHYHPLDIYGDDSPPGIEAIATISAGWKERKEGGLATPHVSRDGQIILHDAGGRAPGLAAALQAGKGKRLTIAFPLDDPAEFIQARYVAYSASNLLAYGDDSQLTIIDPKTGDRQVLQAGTAQYNVAKANCKVARSVYFVLAEWTDQGPEIVFPDGLGYYRLRFTSRNSMRSLRATLASISRFTRGHIAGIPFTLSLDYRDLADSKGARHNAPVWTIIMQPPQGMRLSSKSFAQIAQGALAQGEALMLPAPSQETLELALDEEQEPDLDEIEAGGRCDYDYWIKAWHQAVKGTRFATDKGRANFLLLYTGSRTESLAEFLENATEKEATELIAAVFKEIIPEPDPPQPPSPEQAKQDIEDLFGPRGFPKDQPPQDAEAPTHPVLQPGPLAGFQQAVIDLAQYKASLSGNWTGKATAAQLAQINKMLSADTALLVIIFGGTLISKAEAGALLDQLSMASKTRGAIEALQEAAKAAIADKGLEHELP